MKRSRSSSKSTESVVSSGKDDPPPPKKISKKRVKSISLTQSKASSNSQSPSRSPSAVSTAAAFSTPAAISAPSALSTPVVTKTSSIPLYSASKLGSLPMYGEHVPDNGYFSISKQAGSVCGDLRSIMTEIRNLNSKGAEAEMEVYKQKGLVNFVALKKLNRLSHMYCKDTREQTHEQKLGVDDLHLQLQNLMYEAMHLRKEITNCLEFKSRHEEINLISEDELLSKMPEDTILGDKHQVMLKRLEWELVQRKKLAEQQAVLESTIAKEEKDIKSSKDSLSSILPTLEGIRKATLPLQEALGITLDKRREEQEMALLLPSSLYIFYMQAKAYSDVQDSSLAVSVSGDIGEAKALQNNNENNSDDESGDSDGEGGEKERKKKHRKREVSSSENKISKAHPLIIICTITLKDLGSIQVTFSYLPHFSAVCASVSSMTIDGISDDQLSAYLDKSSLLHCITDGDTGRTSPSATVSLHIRKHSKEAFSSAVRIYGLPYKWVQRVCGISDQVEFQDSASSDQQVEISAESLEAIVIRIKLKLKAQVYLLRQIVSLGSDESKMILGPEADILFPEVVNCKLLKWKHLSIQELQFAISQFNSRSIFNQQERTNKFYLGIFQLGKAHLKCITCVGADYPCVPPVVAIMVEESGEKILDDIQIKNIEADINVHFPNLVKESDSSGQYLLCQQLQRLQNCFDVYMKHKKSDRRAQSIRIRGKGRLLILDDK